MFRPARPTWRSGQERRRENAQRFHEEKARIEALSGVPVIGNRHHLWHMRRDWWTTLEDLAAAGLTYDTSVAFNETPGYRLGIGFPFRPWNPVRDRRIDLLEIPTAIMDGAYSYKPGETPDGAPRHFRPFLEMMKRYQVITTIDWHVHTALPTAKGFAAWGEAFQKICVLAQQDDEVWMPSVPELLELFHTERNRCGIPSGSGL